MALIFIDGFDHYNFADIGFKWTGVLGGSSNFLTGRFGGQCIGFQPFANPGAGLYKSFSSVTTFLFGGAFYTQNAPSAYVSLIEFYDAGGVQVTVGFDTDATLKFSHGGTLLSQTNASVYGPLTYNVWNYIEVQLSCSSSVTSNTCKIYLNGMLYATLNAGQSSNTSGSGGYTKCAIYIGTNQFDPSNYRKWDDIYMAELDSDITGPFGDSKVETLYPTGAGANTAWTPDTGSNYSRVNETLADSDTSYIATNTTSNTDTYTFGDLANSATTIHAVQVTLWNKKDSSATRQIEAAIYIGSTVYNGDPYSPFSSYTAFCSIFRINPSTSASWTGTQVNGAEYGVTCST